MVPAVKALNVKHKQNLAVLNNKCLCLSNKTVSKFKEILVVGNCFISSAN